jgi:ApaG protein
MEELQRYTLTTNSVQVTVTPIFLPDQSLPKKDIYVWAYNVEISNLGKSTIKLLRRHWEVIDSEGHISIVEGDGVVGEQPIIKPKESYKYSSGTFLNTGSGVMKGYYTISKGIKKKEFLVEIPTFSLDSPFETHKPS